MAGKRKRVVEARPPERRIRTPWIIQRRIIEAHHMYRTLRRIFGPGVGAVVFHSMYGVMTPEGYAWSLLHPRGRR